MKDDTTKNIGELFPTIQGRNLEKHEISLPENAEGHVALIVIVSDRNAQAMVDSWITPYDKLCECEGYLYYEVPMISGMWGKFFSNYIDGGMRAGIPNRKHHNVMTFYGAYGEIYESLNITDNSIAHVFLIDKNGIIRWRESGFSSKDALDDMERIARELHDEQ